MDKTKNAEYHYEMVVNIVAEMVVESLKTTARAIDKENERAVTRDKIEGNQGEGHQPRKAA